jgi:hypothetical protein
MLKLIKEPLKIAMFLLNRPGIGPKRQLIFKLSR